MKKQDAIICNSHNLGMYFTISWKILAHFEHDGSAHVKSNWYKKQLKDVFFSNGLD